MSRLPPSPVDFGLVSLFETKLLLLLHFESAEVMVVKVEDFGQPNQPNYYRKYGGVLHLHRRNSVALATLSPFDEEKVSRMNSFCLATIKYHGALCGVDLRISRKSYLSQSFARLLHKSILILMLSVAICDKVSQAIFDLPQVPSINDAIVMGYRVLVVFLYFESVSTLWTKEDILQHFFADDYNVKRITSSRVILLAVIIVAQTWRDLDVTFKSSKTFGGILVNACRMVANQCIYNTYIYFLVIPPVIKAHLADIHRVIGVMTTSRLLNAKRNVRRLVANFNVLFSSLMLKIYVEMFASVYRSSAFMVVRNERWLWFVDLARSFVLLSCLYDLARICTQINSLCKLTATSFVEGGGCVHNNDRRLTTRTSTESWKAVMIMAFHPMTDVLTISNCFVNEVSTLLSYLGGVITCVSILLQFDYKFMGEFDKMRREAMQQ